MYKFGNTEITKEQYDRLQQINQMGNAGILTQAQAASLINDALTPDPTANLIKELLGSGNSGGTDQNGMLSENDLNGMGNDQAFFAELEKRKQARIAAQEEADAATYGIQTQPTERQPLEKVAGVIASPVDMLLNLGRDAWGMAQSGIEGLQKGGLSGAYSGVKNYRDTLGQDTLGYLYQENPLAQWITNSMGDKYVNAAKNMGTNYNLNRWKVDTLNKESELARQKQDAIDQAKREKYLRAQQKGYLTGIYK